MNKGAAWGFFASMQLILLWARCAIILVLFLYLFLAKFSFLRNLALVGILSGAIGNVLDFFIYGHVVDMFYFRFWGYSFPVFNVADASIFCGALLLFLLQAATNQKRSSKG
jgi:signal peptidase II